MCAAPRGDKYHKSSAGSFELARGVSSMIVSTTKLADFVQHHRNWPSPFVALLGVAGGLCGAVPDSWAADPVARDLVAPAGLSWAGGTEASPAVLDFDRDGDFDLVPSRHAAPRGRSCATTATAPSPRSSRSTPPRDDGTAASPPTSAAPLAAHPTGVPTATASRGLAKQPVLREGERPGLQAPLGRVLGQSLPARGVADIRGRGRDALADDFNGDGRMDIAIATSLRPLSPHPQPAVPEQRQRRVRGT